MHEPKDGGHHAACGHALVAHLRELRRGAWSRAGVCTHGLVAASLAAAGGCVSLRLSLATDTSKHSPAVACDDDWESAFL